ncbi:phosphatase PAP2 family protein [Bacillaceae bacterium S4-13-58]
MKGVKGLYHYDCFVFLYLNQYFDYRFIKWYFSKITHLGGAVVTITGSLLLILLGDTTLRACGLASALALTVSHIPVHILKKIYPRHRPYIVVLNTKVIEKPLKDYSFPSGHTTAIFSVIIPLIMYTNFDILLFILAFSVGLSRIVLGLHYPSDVLVGSILGMLTGIISVFIVNFFI